jgi:isochorismate synthase
MNVRTRTQDNTIAETDLLHLLLDHALENNFAIAVWRLPEEDVKHLILSKQYRWIPRETAIEDLSSGFIFAPFDREKQSLFLPADYRFSFKDLTLESPIDPLTTASHTWMQEWLKKSPTPRHLKPYTLPSASVQKEKDHYTTFVQDAVSAIESEQLEKVVASRSKLIQLPPSFDIIHAFQRLCDAYPNALVSFVSSPETGSWLGATPEILVSVEDQHIFKTVALAGTKPFQPGMNLKHVAWTQKEIEEQALVERYVISCFKKIRLREYDEHGPKTVVAGNLLHLRSDFKVDMKATNFPQLGSVMLQLLHPTSAVCGMPLEPARAFLKKHEGYDREFYSGFLGPVNVQNNIHLFVNLRCMQLLEGQAILYAGAGITVDSMPEQEWEETEMKFQTLQRIVES